MSVDVFVSLATSWHFVVGKWIMNYPFFITQWLFICVCLIGTLPSMRWMNVACWPYFENAAHVMSLLINRSNMYFTPPTLADGGVLISRKVIGKHIIISMVIFGPFMGEMYLNNVFNSFIEFQLHFDIIKSRFHYLKVRNRYFHDFGTFGRVKTPPKPILFIFGDTRTPQKNQ